MKTKTSKPAESKKFDKPAAGEQPPVEEAAALPTIDQIRMLSGEPLLQMYALVVGEAPNPKAPVVALRRTIRKTILIKIASEMDRRGATRASAEAPTEAATEAAVDVSAPPIAAEPASDMAEVSAAPGAPAAEEPQDEAAPNAHDGAAEGPATEPAPTDRAEAEDTAVARAEANDAAPAATAQPARDPIEQIVDRFRGMEPGAQRSLLEALDKKRLRALVERTTGTKTSGPLSPASAVERILEALAPAAPATGEDATPMAAREGTGAEAAAETPPAMSDERALPPIGTVLQKRDGRTGAVRCECKIIEGGVEYAGTVYKSLSAAAIAASHDLGNTAKQTNGWLFWGLASAPRATVKKGLDLDVIERAWQRYRERTESAIKDAPVEDRERLQRALAAHATVLLSLTSAAAEQDATTEAA